MNRTYQPQNTRSQQKHTSKLGWFICSMTPILPKNDSVLLATAVESVAHLLPL